MENVHIQGVMSAANSIFEIESINYGEYLDTSIDNNQNKEEIYPL